MLDDTDSMNQSINRSLNAMNQSINRSLNSQLDNPQPIAARLLVFAGERSYDVLSYNPEQNLGVVQSYHTGVRHAFRIAGTAKPVAVRGFQAEDKVELFSIDTVTEGTVILGAVGTKIPGMWRIPSKWSF